MLTVSLLLCLAVAGMPTGATQERLGATIGAFVEEMEPISMRGLTGVYVTVEETEPGAEEHGLTTAQLQADVESRLRKARIRVLTEEEWNSAPGGPCLSVAVNTSKLVERDTYVYSVRMKLMQQVTLERSPIISLWATTWDEAALGGADTEDLRDVRRAVSALLRTFIRDYRAENPIDRSSRREQR